MTTGTEREDRASSIIGFLVIAIIAGAIVGGMFINRLGIGKPKLEVVSSAQLVPVTGWKVSGRVLFDGDLLQDATVWAVASDERGNRYTPGVATSDLSGAFVIDPLPESLSGESTQKTTEVRVFARASVKIDDKEEVVRGEETLSFGSGGQIRRVQLPILTIVMIPGVFVISILMAVVQFPHTYALLAVKWYSSVLLGFLFTGIMIVYISLGLGFVDESVAQNEVLSLGFMNFYHGSYVKDVGPEWLMSLTSPKPEVLAIGGSSLAGGFGAPLWVVLLSVLGAGVFTIRIIVNGIRNPVDLTKVEEVRERVQEVIEHQFFILFSPLGAVFVYQMLVVLGTASNQMTVALAALSSGVALNFVLDRAWQTTSSLFKRSST